VPNHPPHHAANELDRSLTPSTATSFTEPRVAHNCEIVNLWHFQRLGAKFGFFKFWIFACRRTEMGNDLVWYGTVKVDRK